MRLLFRILAQAKKYKWYLIVSILCVFVCTGLNLAAPLFVRELISVIDGGASSDDVPLIIKLGLLLLGFYALRIVVRFLSSYLSHKAAWSFVGDMRVRIYSHLQSLSIGYYSDKQTGQLMSRVITDTSNFELMIAHAIPETIANVITFFGVAALLFWINPVLALLTCIPLPFVAAGAVLFAVKVRPNFRGAQKHIGELSANLQDNLSGMKEIQIFNRQDKGENTVRTSSEQHIASLLGALKVSAGFHPTVEFFTSLGTIIVIIFGGLMAIKGNTNAADITGFLLFLTMFYSPITTLSRVVEDYQNAMASAERVFEVLNESSGVSDSPDAKELIDCHGEICFENVDFSYVPEQQILKNVSFSAPEGTMLALVGPTGVGKSTIISLLMRFYDVGGGRITIDGEDVRNISLASLRENISIVLQDTFLFHGTVQENIAFAKRNACPEEIISAAQKARIHDDIMKMPDGYNTIVGERGMRLSGGQKQRLSIARAILRDAPILVLDEATASVDIETEQKIQEAIAEISQSRTIIVIAHRLSTIRKAGKIVVLEDGEVSEVGTHDELAVAGGLYGKLSFMQASAAVEPNE